MGHEFVGEVVGHGPDCTGQLAVGCRVTSIPILLRNGGIQVIGQHPDAPGSFGELFLVSEALARAVPDTVSLDAVALVDAFAVGEFYVRTSVPVPSGCRRSLHWRAVPFRRSSSRTTTRSASNWQGSSEHTCS
jgi:threonine dehydrogenase-like Zn-dependent dehydrogenase